MADEEKKVEIRKAERRVVPAAPAQEIHPPTPVKINNPLLLTRAAPIPTTCAQCGAPVHRTPSSVPFKGGPHQGGFLCRDCWILEWAENPDIAADAPTRQWFSDEERRIRMRRAGGSSTLYQDGVNKAYLTPRGTVLIDLARLPFGGADEYNPARFKALVRLFKAVGEKIPGFSTALSADEKTAPPTPSPAEPPKA